MTVKILKPASILLMAFSLTLLLACSKDSNSPSKVDLIVKAPWKFSRATASGVDVSGLIQACVKDNILTFSRSSSGNTGKVNEGATKCNPGDPQEVDFTWQFDENFNQLIITGSVTILPGGSNTFKVESVTDTEFILSQNVTFSGTSQLVTVTLIH